jgi:hypothetical protein
MALVAGFVCLGCVKTGEIGVRNASERPVLLLGQPNCGGFGNGQNGPWIQVDPGQEVSHAVVYGYWFGDACLSLSSFDRLRTISVPIRRGREYEVTESDAALRVEDVGKHHQPWYLKYSGADWSLGSPWLWIYGAIILLGAPAGLFITGRFFYRYYILKKE